jgi:hypothetical protein
MYSRFILQNGTSRLSFHSCEIPVIWDCASEIPSEREIVKMCTNCILDPVTS